MTLNMQEFLNALPGMSKRDKVIVQLPPTEVMQEYIANNLTPASGGHELNVAAVTYDGKRFVIETETP